MSENFREFFQPFQKLRWKLSISYTIVTVAILVVLELLVILAALNIIRSQARLDPERLLIDTWNSEAYKLAVESLSEEDPSRLRFSQELIDRSRELQMQRSLIKIGMFSVELSTVGVVNMIFLAPDLMLMGTTPNNIYENQHRFQKFDLRVEPLIVEPFLALVKGTTNPKDLIVVTSPPDYRIAGVLPIIHRNEPKILGYLLFSTRSIPYDLWPLESILKQIGLSILFFTILAGGLGLVFGYYSSRHQIRRIDGLLWASSSWSRGNFRVYADDQSVDEFGQLAKGLNHMAVKLEAMLEERELRSALDERNRLARDLHDNVKQQAFAASAQLGAARTLFKSDPESAEAHLREAERLSYEVRQELTGLIHELHPVPLQSRGLLRAMQEFLDDWRSQNGIAIEVRAVAERELAFELEQNLFRIFQGALSNIARHSQASHAEVSLLYDPDRVTMTIKDDGIGFDPQRQQNSLGLYSMQERADLLNATLTIRSQSGSGTTISVVCYTQKG